MHPLHHPLYRQQAPSATPPPPQKSNEIPSVYYTRAYKRQLEETASLSQKKVKLTSSSLSVKFQQWLKNEETQNSQTSPVDSKKFTLSRKKLESMQSALFSPIDIENVEFGDSPLIFFGPKLNLS